MKLANLVAQFIQSQGIRHVFGVSGGACLHLIHGITETTDVKFIPTTHEQNAAFAADGYARVSGIGCALATSGPGATNLITGIATSYYDSVPVLYLTGNVATHRFGAPLGVRQYGFQETPIVEMVKPITKYAVTVMEPSRILLSLETAVYYARQGRPGPVLVDIPDDLQRMDVNPEALRRFTPPRPPEYRFDIAPVLEALQQAQRPIFVWGAGMRKYKDEAEILARRLNIPVACTWGAIDLLHHDDPLMAGGFGTHGTRAANLGVQNADLVISLGSRLDTKATGIPNQFVRNGALVACDIDKQELEKFNRLGRTIDYPIHADAGQVIKALGAAQYKPEWKIWRALIQTWKDRYPPPDDGPSAGAYKLIRNLDIPKDSIICSDTGFALGWMMQAFPFKGQRFLHAFNMTPMGYGLPAAVGAALASTCPVTLVSGDGSFMMSLPELATVSRWKFPIRIILLNNKAHGMCMQTERQWFGGRHSGTNIDGGLGFPDFQKVADAFGVTIDERHISSEAHMEPQARYGQPIEDADPLLPWDEFKSQMIVPPVERK